MSPDAVFGWLQGRWSFVRVVPGQARMTGDARIMSAGDGVALYEERAEVSLAGGEVLRGEQRYLYRAHEAGFDVLFHQTGLLFHALHFAEDERGGLYAEASHTCNVDHYRSIYRVVAEQFVVNHVVRGPHKDYTMETVYSRVEEADLEGHRFWPERS